MNGRRPREHRTAMPVGLTAAASCSSERVESITSPPARVIRALRTMGLIDFLMYRTEPSPKRALNPSGVKPPSCGRAACGSKGMSSGLVQGMSRLASTARIVFDVPSVMSANDGLSPLPSMVSGPVKTKYAVWSWLRAGRARIAVDRRHLVDQLAVVRAVPGLVEVVLVVQRSWASM